MIIFDHSLSYKRIEAPFGGVKPYAHAHAWMLQFIYLFTKIILPNNIAKPTLQKNAHIIIYSAASVQCGPPVRRNCKMLIYNVYMY